MNRRILLSCFGVPGWAGSSTVLYHLFERMQREGIDVSYLNLLTEQDEISLRRVFPANLGNPGNLDNVHTCSVEPPLWRPHAALTRLIESLAPDVMLGFGVIATRLLELSASGIPVVFMTAGSRRLGDLLATGAIGDFLGFRKSVARGVAFSMGAEEPERRAVENCELIVVHSPLIRFAFDHFFGNHTGKIYVNAISIADVVYPEAESFQHLNRPFAERDIDLIFVAADWSRPEKNYRLLRKIVRRCNGLQVHVVGAFARPCPSARHHGRIVGRERLYELLGRSKTLVCPSSLDAAPAVLFEASALGCNVVASPNCGNWELCNERLVTGVYSADGYLDKIAMSLDGPHRDNRERFRGGYDDLVETLAVC